MIKKLYTVKSVSPSIGVKSEFSTYVNKDRESIQGDAPIECD